MKIEVAKTDLEVALQVVRLVVGTTGNDLSTHYLFRVGPNAEAEVLAFHQRLFSSTALKCNVEGDEGDAFTVEAWRLDKWLNGVSGTSLTLGSGDGGNVNASGGRSKIRLRSLDPTKFPYWDTTFSEAEDVGSVSSVQLAAALGYSKRFVAAEDTTRPAISQVEVIDGVLWASDRRTVSLVEVDGLEKSNLRVAGKDLGTLARFLSLKDSGSTGLLQHDAAFFFVRDDGSHLGVSRPQAEFPLLKVDREAADEALFTVSADDLRSAVAVLSASAPKDNTNVRVRANGKGVVLSMASEAGGDDEYPVACSSIENADVFAEEGFVVDYPYILGIIDHFGLGDLNLGVNRRGKGGYVAFRHAEQFGTSDSNYHTVMVWRV